jgi:HK97 family phage portal protein
VAVFAGPRRAAAATGEPLTGDYAYSDRFESRALSFLQPPIGAHAEALQNYGAGDPEGALKHSALWACADLIASSMAMLTPWAMQGIAVGAGTSQRVPVQPQILLQPGAGDDIYDFLYMGTMSACLKGNIFGQAAGFDRLMNPVQIELENPGVVSVRREQDGTYEYKYRNQVVKPPQLWHKAMFRFPGSPLGMSPIEYGVMATRLGLNAENYGNQYFEDGGHPTALLTNEKVSEIDMKDARTLKARFMSGLRGSREPVVLGGGWKYDAVQTTPDQAQFLATQKLSDSKVCRFMRVQPEMVGCASEGSAITYANVEQRSIDFLTYCMFRWIKRWEMWLGRMLPPGEYVKFDIDSLLRVDFLTLWRGLHMAVGSRIITQDEGREIIDRAPLTAEQKAQIDSLVTAVPPPISGPRVGE